MPFGSARPTAVVAGGSNGKRWTWFRATPTTGWRDVAGIASKVKIRLFGSIFIGTREFFAFAV